MFRLVERPTLMPACSLLRTTVGPMVDTETILHNGGRVYLTEVEGWEIVNKFPTYTAQLGMRAREAGWLPPDEAAAKDAEIARLSAALAAAEDGAPKVVALADVEKLLAAGTV